MVKDILGEFTGNRRSDKEKVGGGMKIVIQYLKKKESI